MGGNYEKSVYDQLMEVMARLDTVEADSRQAHKEIKTLNNEVYSLRSENAKLRKKVSVLQDEVASLTDENAQLKHENTLLTDEVERLKRKGSNNSSNSSLPPSRDLTKPANTYNGRKPTKRKQGAQEGHTGTGLSKTDVEKYIKDGTYRHRIETIGSGEGRYITRYRIDLETKPVATEIRIYPDADGKYNVPDELKGVVSYGNSIKAVTAYLYSEGVVANDRIAQFIRSLSGGSVNISDGCVYGICRRFGDACASACSLIENNLMDAYEICTDATVVSTNGKQSYIRNFSTDRYVLYCGSDNKNLSTLKSFRLLSSYAGRLMHDHETALYNFGTGHAECNVHIGRYLRKNTEETGSRWSRDMAQLLLCTEAKRKELKAKGAEGFTAQQTERISKRYDEIIRTGMAENMITKGRFAKAEEKKLLRRLMKYKDNHLLYIYDFRIHYSNNMSEKDLRISKSREKMAGGFRTADGRAMYCRIMSVIETMKRQSINIFDGIIGLLAGKPVIR